MRSQTDMATHTQEEEHQQHEQITEAEKEEEEEEEEEAEDRALVLKTTKVVEYLEPVMSLELLCKFPDNSAYDFDYSQSTIWSPLAPRPYSTPVDMEFLTPRNLSYDMGLELLGATSNKKKKEGSYYKLRKKFTTTTAFNLNLDFIKKQSSNKKVASNFSPTPIRIKVGCNPIIKKGWAKALKAASKQFKRWKAKRDPAAHVMLPRSFRDGDF